MRIPEGYVLNDFRLEIEVGDTSPSLAFDLWRPVELIRTNRAVDENGDFEALVPDIQAATFAVVSVVQGDELGGSLSRYRVGIEADLQPGMENIAIQLENALLLQSPAEGSADVDGTTTFSWA